MVDHHRKWPQNFAAPVDLVNQQNENVESEALNSNRIFCFEMGLGVIHKLRLQQ